MDYILKNCFIIPQHSSESTVNIHIKDGMILKIVDSKNDIKKDSAAQFIIDLKGKIVIPGFVDSHTHLDKALIGSKVSNKSGTLNEAIDLMKKYKKDMTKKEITNRARKAIEKSVENGIRYIRTHIDVDKEIKLTSIEAILSLKEEYKNLIDIQVVAFPQQGINEEPENLYYLEEAIRVGADIIGGIPAQELKPDDHIKKIFELATKYDKDIDMHIDETDDISSLTIKTLLEFTKKYEYQDRVSAGHLCSLAGYANEEIKNLVEDLISENMNIISLPSTNLYLQGRNDKRKVRRGIAPIKYFSEKQASVMIGSGNNQDPFNPFGNFNMLEEALITAHGTHMGGEAELNAIFDMITVNPGHRLKFNYSIQENEKANFVVLNAHSKSQSIIKQSNIYGQFKRNKFYINKDE